MESSFVKLLSCLHQAPCFNCDETHRCDSTVKNKLVDYAGQLSGWACKSPHAKGSGIHLAVLARDFEVELAHLRPDCPGLLPRPNA